MFGVSRRCIRISLTVVCVCLAIGAAMLSLVLSSGRQRVKIVFHNPSDDITFGHGLATGYGMDNGHDATSGLGATSGHDPDTGPSLPMGYDFAININRQLRVLRQQIDEIKSRMSLDEMADTDILNAASPSESYEYYQKQSPEERMSHIQDVRLNHVTEALQHVDQDNEELIRHIREHWIIPPSTEPLDLDNPGSRHHAQV